MFHTVVNESNNNLLASRLFIADSFFTRFKGLLGKKALNSGDGLLLVPCSSVHTMFMRFNLDLVFLDKKNLVVKTIAGLPPWRIVPPVFGAIKTLELPAGTIVRSNTEIGNTLKIRMSRVTDK
ncbi:MAG: DUF192 domain-containing protein [Peptococcaceae bacterium]|nr:DUF192 domain-containing protein [Peptococcaceae bacterium]